MCCGSFRPSLLASPKSLAYCTHSLRFSARGLPQPINLEARMSGRPRHPAGQIGLGKDFLELLSIPGRELTALLRLAAQLKLKQRRGMAHPLLAGRMLGLVFQKPSTRTRVSFEAGMN